MKKIINKIIFLFICSLSLSSCGFFNDIFNLDNDQYLTNPEDGLKITKTYKVKNINEVTGQLTLDSTGEQNILVIPVSFRDYEENNTSEYLNSINKAFFGTRDETSYESVSSFYEKSSYGKLKIKGKVADKWFDSGIYTYQLKGYTTDASSGENGTLYLLDKAVNWYKENYNDIADFDNDKDGIIDAVWLVYNAPNYQNNPSLDDTFWAFTFWNLNNLNTTNYNSVLYSFASVDFIFGDGDLNYPDARTYIHETGHMLGLIDYYSDNSSAPAGMVDMMDFNIGDHNAYSKFSLGWVNPRIATKSGEYTLKPFQENGDCIIVPGNNYNNTPYDEYFMIEYVTPTNLNYQDYNYLYEGKNLIGYQKSGIKITHIDSTGYSIYYQGSNMYAIEQDDYTKMDILLTSNFVNRTYDFLLDDETNLPFLRYTLMQKNYSKNFNILEEDFLNSVPRNIYSLISDFLFFKDDVFDIKNNSKYKNLMPSLSNKLNDGTYFNSQIIIGELNKDEAKISINL